VFLGVFGFVLGLGFFFVLFVFFKKYQQEKLYLTLKENPLFFHRTEAAQALVRTICKSFLRKLTEYH